MNIVTRDAAVAVGASRYFTGQPCKNGHLCERYCGNRSCVECSAIKSRSQGEYLKAYYREKADHLRAKAAARYGQKREAILEGERNRRRVEPDKYRAKEASRAESRAPQRRAYRLREKSKIESYMAKWRSENTPLMLASNSRRRADESNAVPSWAGELDDFVIQEAFVLAAQRKQATGIDWHVDHQVPLRARKACGLHCAANIQVIPAELNLQKHNKMIFMEPREWLKAL